MIRIPFTMCILGIWLFVVGTIGNFAIQQTLFFCFASLIFSLVLFLQGLEKIFNKTQNHE